MRSVTMQTTDFMSTVPLQFILSLTLITSCVLRVAILRMRKGSCLIYIALLFPCCKMSMAISVIFILQPLCLLLLPAGRVKCEAYWPQTLGEDVVYGDLVVTKRNESVLPEYTIRIFDIKLVSQTYIFWSLPMVFLTLYDARFQKYSITSRSNGRFPLAKKL